MLSRLDFNHGISDLVNRTAASQTLLNKIIISVMEHPEVSQDSNATSPVPMVSMDCKSGISADLNDMSQATTVSMDYTEVSQESNDTNEVITVSMDYSEVSQDSTRTTPDNADTVDTEDCKASQYVDMSEEGYTRDPSNTSSDSNKVVAIFSNVAVTQPTDLKNTPTPTTPDCTDDEIRTSRILDTLAYVSGFSKKPSTSGVSKDASNKDTSSIDTREAISPWQQIVFAEIERLIPKKSEGSLNTTLATNGSDNSSPSIDSDSDNSSYKSSKSEDRSK